MKNAIAVVCAVLLPLNLTPQIAFAAGNPKPADDSVVTHNKVTYMKVAVPGQKDPYYCEVKECKDPATLQKLGSVPLYYDFDKDGDPTLSQYSVTYDPKTKSNRVITTQANSYSATVAAPDDKGKAAVQVFVAGTSGKKETYYTTKEGTTADKPTLFKEDGKTPSGYELKPHPDHKGHFLAVRENPVREAPAAPVMEKTPKTAKQSPPASSAQKNKSELSLETLCTLRDQLPDPSEKEKVALKQLQAAKDGDMGISSDGQSVSSIQSSELDAKCAEFKKQKALADSGKTDDGKVGVGTVAAPPAVAAQEPSGASASTASSSLLENWGSYAGGIGGGIVLAVIAAAIMGGPIGLAAGAGAAVGLVGMALYNNRDEIGQAVSTGVLAVVDFFKGG